MQTLGIIGNLAIKWPPAVIWITTTLSGNVLDLNFVRPECLLIDVEVSPYFAFTIGACSVVLGITVVIVLVKGLIRFLAPFCFSKDAVGKAIDTVEFVQSIIFSGELTPTWQVSYMLVSTSNTGEFSGTIGGVMGYLLQAVNFFFVCIYFYQVRLVERKRAVLLANMAKMEGELGGGSDGAAASAKPPSMFRRSLHSLSSRLNGRRPDVPSQRPPSPSPVASSDSERALALRCEAMRQSDKPSSPKPTSKNAPGRNFLTDPEPEPEPVNRLESLRGGAIVVGGMRLGRRQLEREASPRTAQPVVMCGLAGLPSPPPLVDSGRGVVPLPLLSDNDVINVVDVQPVVAHALVVRSEYEAEVEPRPRWAEIKCRCCPVGMWQRSTWGACLRMCGSAAFSTGYRLYRFLRYPHGKMPKDVEYRMSYLTDRFAYHSASWQFVIWFRQLLLFIDATAGRHFLADTATLSEDEDEEGEEWATMTDKEVALLWIHASFALLVLLVFWYRHTRIRPYEFAFQASLPSPHTPRPLTLHPLSVNA